MLFCSLKFPNPALNRDDDLFESLLHVYIGRMPCIAHSLELKCMYCLPIILGHSILRWIPSTVYYKTLFSGTEVIFMVSKPHGWPKLPYVLPTCGDWSTVEGNGGPGNIGKAIFSTIFILITGSLALIIKYFV